ncbi:MAG: PKD domain-containing protein [Candidatus Sulfobium sp.]
MLEHRIFEDDFRVDSISTAKLIQLNNGQEAGVGDLLKIDKTNVDSVLADLDLSDDIKADITNAVNEGLVVRIPEVNGLPVTAMDYEDWTGLCYIKEDPDTGEAGYMLSGMVAKGTVPDLPAEQSRAVESGLSPALIAGGMTAVSPDKWVSRDLRNTLDQPYLENIVINPVAVNIIFPYDGAILSVSTVDVEGIASDPIAVVTVNGTNATVSKDGRFIAKGVALKEGPNLIEVAASSIFGGTASAVIRVSYKPSQATPMKISVTYPPDGDTINRPFTMVKGKVITDAKEISLKVNGIPAEIYGDQFVINDVPLTDGDNAIIANAVDSDGSVARDEVSVKADTLKPCVTLSANITSGIPSLTTYFRASTEMPGPVANYQVDFDGDGVIDYTGEALEDVSYTYTTEGIYYPEVIVTDDQGNTFTDSIAITVLNKAQIDALLKRKWEGMKTELENGNIAEAGRFFIVRSQERYRTIFEALKDKLPTILSTFTEFNIVSVYERIAEYEIVANENGTLYSYPGIFIKDVDGIWKFKDF